MTNFTRKLALLSASATLALGLAAGPAGAIVMPMLQPPTVKNVQLDLAKPPIVQLPSSFFTK